MPAETDFSCPCSSRASYDECCGRFHAGSQLPETAEQLMRSRYSAYVIKNSTYLLSTWDEETRPQNLYLENSVRWIRLDILAAKQKPLSEVEATVEFEARYIDGDKLFCLHEVSNFIRHNGRWFYHSGKIADEPVELLSRNMSCPCGSGKKYKRCCL